MHCRERAVGAQKHGLDILVAPDAGDDRIGPFGPGGGRGHADCTAFIGGDPGFRALVAAIVDDDLMPGFGQMARHRAAHRAEAEETDTLGFTHGVALMQRGFAWAIRHLQAARGDHALAKGRLCATRPHHGRHTRT